MDATTKIMGVAAYALAGLFFGALAVVGMFTANWSAYGAFLFVPLWVALFGSTAFICACRVYQIARE